MLHSRGFEPHENQPYAAQTRTPGPSRSHLSPSRFKVMTTGKRALSDKARIFAQEPGSLGPKQLFKDLTSNKTPARALGDRTNKTPGPSSFRFKNSRHQEGGSPSKGGLKENGKSRLILSPEKGSKSASPQKALKSLYGRFKEASTPFAKADQSYMTDLSTMMTPVPSGSAFKQRLLSGQSSFVTPAANIGKAGQIKARMGEMMDAELGVNVDEIDTPEVKQSQAQKLLTEEELYPEIEYMPPSTWATNPPYEFPAELDGLPRAKEIGEQLAKFRPAGFLRGAIGLTSDSEDDEATANAFGTDAEQDLVIEGRDLSDDEGSEDEFWPDLPVAALPLILTKKATVSVSTVPRSVSAQSKMATNSIGSSRPGSIASSSVSSRMALRPATTLAGARTAAPASQLTTAAANGKPPARPPSKPVSTPGITARSVGPTSMSRTAAAGTTTARSAAAVRASQLSTAGVRTGATAVRQASSLSRSITPAVAPSAARYSAARPQAPARASSSANKAPVAATKPIVRKEMNPKLKDLVNDDLGDFVERKLKDNLAENGFEGLALGEEPNDDDVAASNLA